MYIVWVTPVRVVSADTVGLCRKTCGLQLQAAAATVQRMLLLMWHVS